MAKNKQPVLVAPPAPAAPEPVAKRGRGRPRKNAAEGATIAQAAAAPAAPAGNAAPAPPDPATPSASPDDRPPVVVTKSEPVPDGKKKPVGPAKAAVPSAKHGNLHRRHRRG